MARLPLTRMKNLTALRLRRKRRSGSIRHTRRSRFERLEDRMMLAVYTVDSLQDNTTSGDSVTTLREAVVAANANSNTDVIEFASSLTASGPATITLSMGQLALSYDVAITGPGMDLLTIDADGGSRVFLVDGGVDASISGLTITGGSSSQGSGVYAIGDLALDSVRVANNTTTGSGGGIFVYGTLMLDSSIVNGNNAAYGGGGIWVNDSAYATIVNSTIDDNEAVIGGGIFGYLQTGDRLLVENSTVSNNGIQDAVIGGGLFIQSAGTGSPCVATIINSTISGNMATYSGGIRVDGSAAHVDLINSTIAYNEGNESGGIQLTSSATSSLDNTIVAENKNAAGTTKSDVYGTLDTGSSYNLIGSGGSGGLSNGTNHNIVLTSSQNAGLLPLGYFGGPTKSHALLIGSPALDAGNDNLALDADGVPLEFDQRGHLRPFDLEDVTNSGNGIVDIGAFEAGNPANLPVKVTDDEPFDDIHASDFDWDDLSLREALAIAAGGAGSYEIQLDSLGGTIYLEMGELVIEKGDSGTISIIGPSASGQLTIDAQDGSRVFHIAPGTVASISRITITGGHTTTGGGGIRSEGDLSLSSCTIIDNYANLGGGVLTVGGGTTTISDSKIANNNAVSFGGIGQITGALEIRASEIIGNSAFSIGGIYIVGGDGTDYATLTIESSIIANNSAQYTGGLTLSNTEGSISSTTISGNAATTQYSGGVEILTSPGATPQITFTNDTITENNGAYRGGITNDSNSGAIVTLKNTIVAGNIRAGTTPSDVFGAFDESSSNNLIGVLPASGGLENDATTLALSGTASSPADARLIALEDVGGPANTFMLPPDSPAIDAGDDDAAVDLVFDQLGDGFQRKVGEHVDIGASEAHLILRGDGTLEIYGTDLDDNITIGEESVTLDLIGEIVVDVSSANEVVVDSGGGGDHVTVDEAVSSKTTVIGLPDPVLDPPWDDTTFKWEPGRISLINDDDLPSLEDESFPNNNWIGANFNAGWNIDVNKFYDSNTDRLVEGLGIIQIVKSAAEASFAPLPSTTNRVQLKTDLEDALTRDWRIDNLGVGIWYPFKSTAILNSDVRIAITDDLSLSIHDAPGTPFNFVNGEVYLSDYFMEFETYVVSFGGPEGYKVDEYQIGIDTSSWLSQITVYGGVKWDVEWVRGDNGAYDFDSTGPTTVNGISDNFKEALWKAFWNP